MDFSAELDAESAAQAFADLFRETYLKFHRRDGKRNELSGASRAVLLHLSQAGPMTVGELAVHLDRAQSVVSDIVTQLEGKDLLERERDPEDRRRTLVWLTASGFTQLAAERSVLGTNLLATAFASISPAERANLLTALTKLVASPVPTTNGVRHVHHA